MKKVILFFLTVALYLPTTVLALSYYDADISVDVTAATVSLAKKEAMAKATRDGIRDVVLSIGTEEGADEVNKLTDGQLQHFISGVMVLMEKSSDVRYIADLRVTVNGEVLKAYMIENNLPIVAGEEYDVLAIPLMEKEDGELDLWSDENLWRQAFSDRKNLQKGNISVYGIEKNLGNITAVETNRIYDMSEAEYEELSSFNRVNDIYVLKYSLKDGKVYIKSFPNREVAETEIGDNSPEQMVDKVLPFFKDNQKTRKMAQQEIKEEKIEAVYNYSQLGSWMTLKRMLEENPQVSGLKVVSMVNGKVRFSFVYSGILEKLFANLGISGYQFKNEGDYYAIY